MNDDRTSCLSNRKPAKRIYGTDLSLVETVRF